MTKFGLPELEIRDVPDLFVEAACCILRSVCHYLKTPGVVVRAGETMAISVSFDQSRFLGKTITTNRNVGRSLRARQIVPDDDYVVAKIKAGEKPPLWNPEDYDLLACLDCGCVYDDQTSRSCDVRPEKEIAV